MPAINAAVMHSLNRKLILNSIRARPVSRVELARETKLTRATVTYIVDELLAEGLVREGGPAESGRLGRRSTLLTLTKDRHAFIGVNLGRRQCGVGTMNLGGEVLSRRTIPVEGRSVRAVQEEIAEAAKEQADALTAQGIRAESAGVCAPGPLNSETGTLLTPPNFAGWHGRNVTEPVERATGLKAYLDNCSNAHALTESYFGVAAGAESFVLLRVDEGVSSGVIVDGQPYSGTHRFASELGHMSVDLNGLECDCGNRGCLEKYIALPALLKGTRYADWAELVDSVGEREADEVTDRLVNYLSAGIVNIINAFDVGRVVIAGELTYRSETLFRRVNENVLRRAIFPMAEPPVIAGSEADPIRMGAAPAYRAFFTGLD